MSDMLSRQMSNINLFDNVKACPITHLGSLLKFSQMTTTL